MLDLWSTSSEALALSGDTSAIICRNEPSAAAMWIQTASRSREIRASLPVRSPKSSFSAPRAEIRGNPQQLDPNLFDQTLEEATGGGP